MQSYSIVEVGEPVSYGKATPFHFSFIISDQDGNQIKYFETGRGKLFYAVIVRREGLCYFEHLHPTLDKRTGVFTIANLKLPDYGNYRLFTDFIPLDTALEALPHATAHFDFSLPGKYELKPLGNPERTQNFGMYKVALETKPEPPRPGKALINFTLRVDEKVLTDLEDHLGAPAHLVTFRKDTLEYEHIAASGIAGAGTLQFEAAFPRAGSYKLFLEFRHNEKTTTCEYLLRVEALGLLERFIKR